MEFRILGLVHADSVVSTDRLTGIRRGDSAPTDAVSALQTYSTSLQDLESRIVRQAPTLTPKPEWSPDRPARCGNDRVQPAMRVPSSVRLGNRARRICSTRAQAPSPP